MGVDGCAAGWVGVLRSLRGKPPRVYVAARFAELLTLREVPSFVAVDIPIGLPERIGEAGRGPEALLRPRLGERQSSVFAIPSRAAVSCDTYEEACRVAAETSEPSRMVSKQAFFLFPKIRELDALMRADPGNAYFIHESHPEAVFMTMNDGRPLGEPKKRRGAPHAPGLELRRDLVSSVAGFERPFLHADLLSRVGDDDLLDACACSWTAERIALGTAVSYPSPPLHDAHGIPIAIWT
jgi:predicted RNase H-like nuclease